MGEPQLENRCLRLDLLHVLIGNAGADHPDPPVAFLDPVERTALGPLRQCVHASLHQLMPATRVAGHHHGLRYVSHKAGRSTLHPFAQFYDGLRVGQASGDTQQHRGVEALADLERGPRELLCLLGIAWLQHRDLRQPRVVPVVLLVLGAEHAGIIGGDDHQAATHSDIGSGDQGIGGDVQANVLHRDQRPGAGQGGAERYLKCHLLIWRPFSLDLRVLDQGFQDLGGGCAWVGGGNKHAGLKCPPGDGLIAGKEHASGGGCRNRHGNSISGCFHQDSTGPAEAARE